MPKKIAHRSPEPPATTSVEHPDYELERDSAHRFPDRPKKVKIEGFAPDGSLKVSVAGFAQHPAR
jgi:hypothetical protein